MFDDPLEMMMFSDGSDVRVAGASSPFAALDSAAEVSTATGGYSPNGIWVFDQADVPINDKVGSVNFTSKGTTYPTFEQTVSGDVVGISNSSWNTLQNVGGIYSSATTDWDRGSSAGSYFLVIHFLYTYAAFQNYHLIGSFKTTADASINLFQSSTSGYIGMEWRESGGPTEQTVFLSGLSSGTVYTLLAGYDPTTEVIGMCTSANTTGAWSTANATIRTAALTIGQYAFAMGKPTGSTDTFATSRSVLAYAARFEGAAHNGWYNDRAAIVGGIAGAIG